ncbi:trypsin-like peptidase domain-containing protein [Akkermansiaceae bacterium]|nr:trypsin-like peptidase domain-containing protein [Akkermansiaceae bacterium]
MENTKQPAPVERIQGKGLRLSLSVFKKLKAFQAGGQYWEHQSQNSIREYMGDFLPLMQVEEDGESVLCQMFVAGKEVSSESRQAKGIPSAQRKKLEDSIQRLKDRASAPDVDSNVKKIIEAFRLPDPRKDPELYRLYGSRWNPKLMVVWGCEKEEGTSLPPEEVSQRVAKESAGGTFIRKLPIILLILILLGALAWFFSNSDFSKQDEVADGSKQNIGQGAGGSADTENDNTQDTDTDGDGIGDKADKDDDNDGIADQDDKHPRDTDNDGIENREDADDDNDGTSDAEDDLPLNPREDTDTDGDGIGDKADKDDDNDGIADQDDNFPRQPKMEPDNAPDRPADIPLTVEDGPSTEEEIQKRKEDIQQALKEGKAIKSTKPARIATRDEVNLAKSIRPAVVTIVVSKGNGEYDGQGTGFLITQDGIVVTNHHVVKQTEAIKAVLSDGRVLPIEVIASDAKRDLALLRISRGSYSFLRLADKGKAEQGELIAVMGSPKGLSNTYSTGVISELRPGGVDGVDKLQISAAVSPGSSGSPVVSQKTKKVVGIVQGGITGEHAQALNLAIDVAELHEMRAMASNSDPEVEASIDDSGKLEAQNEKVPETIPDDVLVPKTPEGGKVSWQLSPGAAVPAPTAPVPVPQDARLELGELRREVLANGKIKITFKAKIREEEGELNQLKGIDCTLDNKKVDINGSMLTMICDEGANALRITWIGQSGKKRAINRDINIQVIRVE